MKTRDSAMTRRGSLAYYLCRVDLRLLFMSVAICLKDRLALVGANYSSSSAISLFLFLCIDAWVLCRL